MTIHMNRPAIEDPPFCWLLKRHEQLIGVSKANGWCSRLRDESPVYFYSEEKFVFLMILLELDKPKFFDFLDEAAAANPDYANSIRQFPLTLLLKHVFHSSVSDYWPAKALDWLEDEPALLPSFVDELEHMVNHKVMSQTLRHRARRILRSVAPRELAPH